MLRTAGSATSGGAPWGVHAQRWLLDNLLDNIALRNAAHGFRKQ